jgi:AraC-type DNA-binding domain-containing proteins
VTQSHLTPDAVDRVVLTHGRIEVVEWRWPDIIAFTLTEQELMLEMSLPPYATDASAEFPEIAPGRRCFVGTLFIRLPGVAIEGRGEGGHIRVLRIVFDEKLARSALGDEPPSLEVMQGMLDIRSDSLRKIMSLTLREMNSEEERSEESLAALQTLAAVEISRLLKRQIQASPGGRLAAWRYRRIRERLSQGGAQPTAGELAALCGISVRHLNRQFQALTGRTIADYVTNYWLEQAKAMLADGEIPIKNVAFALGFTHANSFARAFGRATGETPTQYRQRKARADDQGVDSTEHASTSV